MKARSVSSLLTRVLRHPMVMAVKRPVKDVAWALRGWPVRNPALPATVGSILFVCQGNICRSPFAAVFAERLLREMGVPVIACQSAGIATTQAARPPVHACAAALSYGVSLDAHRPQPLGWDLVAAHDMVIVMEAWQFWHLRRQYPGHAGRVFLLSLFDPEARRGYDRYHIADPFGEARAAFDDSYTRIDRALRALLSAVTPRATSRQMEAV